MDTRFTVADLRTALYMEVDATDINSALFLPALNEVSEYFTYSGAWKGNTPKVTIPASDGFFTLPRWYQSVLVLRYQRAPRPIFSQFYEFSESGPGELQDTDSFCGVLVDMGDGYATQSDITTAGTLRVTVGGAGDAAKVLRLYGTDAYGNVIYDSSGNQGINITTVNPSTDTTQVFATVTGIQAPANMTLPWTLSVVNSGTPTQLGSYYPGETRPCYKRYRVGQTDEAAHTICRRRFVPLVAETDWVIGSLRAYRYGLKGLAFEKAGQIAEAKACFTEAFGFLNEEAKASRGGARPMININTEMSWGVQIGA